MALGNLDFSQLKIILKATGDPKTEVAIRYGNFINVVIAFVVVALVVYVIASLLLRPAPEEPADQDLPVLQGNRPGRRHQVPRLHQRHLTGARWRAVRARRPARTVPGG
jgi:cell division protein FtsN